MQYSLDCALQQNRPAGSHRNFLPQMALSCIRNPMALMME
jgi:hypothetical protein